MDEQVLFQKFVETHWGVREMRNKNRYYYYENL